MDGTQLIKVWGFGTDPEKQRIRQGKRRTCCNFKGINAGKTRVYDQTFGNTARCPEECKDFFNTFLPMEAGISALYPWRMMELLTGLKWPVKNTKVGSVMSIRHAALRQNWGRGIIKKLGQDLIK